MDSKTAGALLNEFYSLVDYTKPSFQVSLLAIVFNPTAWNFVARNGTRHFHSIFEETKTRSWLLFTSPTISCL